jgi:ABC-type phosphate/phosphonate transport system substrate-binding protein
MIASLPMYHPAGEAVQVFWARFATLLGSQTGSSIPSALYSPDDLFSHWRSPDLLLSQTCGYPLSTQLFDQVQLVGTFAYDVPGARGIACRSQLICRASDVRRTLPAFAASTVAYNAQDSQSGYNALRALVARASAQRPFFSQALESGAHARSIELVLNGKADIAAIDAVTWALWQQANPDLAGALRVFGETDAYPGLPLITALGTPPALLRQMRDCLLTIATHADYAAYRQPLHIQGFEITALADYAPCTAMEAQALALGMPAL